MSYRLQIASDVVRDGLGVELIDETNEVVAEVFRRDSDNQLLFSSFKEDVPFVEVEKLILASRTELQNFEDGSAFPDRKP
jgi:hypothetical protein